MGASPQADWEDVERVLDQALTLAPDDRSAFLEQTRSGDPALAAAVERLLRAVEDSDGFLAESGLGFAAALMARVAEQCVLVPGDRFENYEVVRELGHGGMATVYLAQDLRHGRQVALKVLRPELSASLGADRFAREIAFAAQLNHPHILPLHDSGTLDLGMAEPVLFYAMPYVPGGSLRDRLRKEPQLPIAEALRIASQVAEALEYAHRHDVVHRDIKPENILLIDGHALVADFGIARALDRAATDAVTQTGLVLGTPAYMSPEQAATAQLDGRSDIYSLGCVVYEMLAGHPPFAGTTVQTVLARHAVDPVPALRTVRRTVPAGVEHAIERALAKVPADRFATAREFAEALAAPEPASAGWLAALSSGRRKVAFAVLAVLLLIVLGVWRFLRPMAPLDPKRVAVATFANNTGDATLETLGDITLHRLASGLTEIQLVQVVDARAVQGAGAQARQGSGEARTLAQGLGAGTVLWGSYYRRGDSLEFEAQLSDTRTGQVVVPIQSATGPAADPSIAIELLRQHAMGALAWHFDPKIEEVKNSNRPSNYEAYREFLAADDINQPNINCRFAQCGYEHWRRAYALDTAFTLPLILIARDGEESGRCELTDSIAEALRLRHDRLPAHDRAALDAAVAGCHGERRLQLDAARAAVTAGGSTPDAIYLNSWLRKGGYFREAISAIERLNPAIVDNGLALPYHLLGEHEKELAAAEAVRHAAPDNLAYMAMQAFAYVGLGRLDKVEQVVEAMLKVPANVETWGVTPVWALTWVAADLDAHGDSAEARDLSERALAWHRSRPQEEQDDHERSYAVALYGAGHWLEARTVVQHLIATADPGDSGNPDIRGREAQSYLGGIAAHLGDQQEMERVDRWLASRKGPYLNGVPTFDRARMAAIRGDRERAMTLIRLAVDQGYPIYLWGFGLHIDPDFKALWGYPPFEELRRPQESAEGL
jgi:TolB-like protein